MICKECNEDRDERYFSKTKNKGKNKDVMPYHFWLKKCKICQGVKVLKGSYNKVDGNTRVDRKLNKKIVLSKDTNIFLNYIKMKRGYVNMVDAYKLAHYFIEAFGYIDIDDMEIKDQLILMYDKLLKAQDEYSRN